MKLYYSRGACSLVVRIILHEIGISAMFESVDLKTKKTETGADYFKINVKGSVPAIELDNHEILTENTVILQYLCDTHNASALLPEIGGMQRYRILEKINFVSTELHKGFGPLFNPAVPQEIKDSIFIPLLKKKLSLANQFLQGQKFLCGNSFTLPDAYLFVVLRWTAAFKIDLTEWPELARFFAEMKNRKSVQQALQEENLK